MSQSWNPLDFLEIGIIRVKGTPLSLMRGEAHAWEALSQRAPLVSAGPAIPPGFCKAKTSDGIRFQYESHAGGFLLANFFGQKKIGQNWNGTSDTRIFSLQKPYLAITLDDLKSPYIVRSYRENGLFSTKVCQATVIEFKPGKLAIPDRFRIKIVVANYTKKSHRVAMIKHHFICDKTILEK